MLDIFNTQPNTDDDKAHYLVNLGNNAYPVSMELQEVLSHLEQHDTVHWVSKGAWNMIDMLVSALQITGNSDVIISTYAFSEKPARIIADLVQSGIITSLQCIIDSRVDTRSASALTLVQNQSQACKLMDTHAKVTLLHSPSHTITICGSANYTSNKRYEAGIISKLPETFSFHKKWITHELRSTNA